MTKRKYNKGKLEVLTMNEIIDVLKEVSIVPYDGEAIAPKKAGSFGYYDPNNKTIYYDSSRPDDVRVRTIMHELVHAYNDIFNLRDSERRAINAERNTWREYKKNG